MRKRCREEYAHAASVSDMWQYASDRAKTALVGTKEWAKGKGRPVIASIPVLLMTIYLLSQRLRAKSEKEIAKANSDIKKALRGAARWVAIGSVLGIGWHAIRDTKDAFDAIRDERDELEYKLNATVDDLESVMDTNDLWEEHPDIAAAFGRGTDVDGDAAHAASWSGVKQWVGQNKLKTAINIMRLVDAAILAKNCIVAQGGDDNEEKSKANMALGKGLGRMVLGQLILQTLLPRVTPADDATVLSVPAHAASWSGVKTPATIHRKKKWIQ